MTTPNTPQTSGLSAFARGAQGAAPGITLGAPTRVSDAAPSSAVIDASVASAVASATPTDAYVRRWSMWHDRRVEELTAPHGYLAPVSITWVAEGESARVPRVPGTWVARDDTLVYVPDGAVPPSAHGAIAPSPAVTLNATPVDAPVAFRPSLFGEEALAYLDYGDLRVEVNAQTDLANRTRHRFWIRVKDPQAKARRTFDGIDTYPVDPSWRLPASFRRATGKELDIHDSVVTTVLQSYPVVGSVDFEYDGTPYSLVVCNVFGHVTVFFSDETTGSETYAIGRVLHLDPLHLDDLDSIDFNYAFNYPCAFSRFCTCPIPSKRNHLPFKVTAGEKNPRNAAEY
ncbi:hypothetical protein PSRA_0919 [Pseudoscardovia radai]|uniref:DUF1684 domain-containing protein n=1 Tax=Pseudoscardovia radai TaxID=987066 RepID=A0A261EY97_9BIFI|nr:DUF1684 domain-containing protein [Pseudoscardovia radai]OZG51839.1 hypothetical protein PSRA_0919 [Pseudoscardovia radai]